MVQYGPQIELKDVGKLTILDSARRCAFGSGSLDDRAMKSASNNRDHIISGQLAI